MNNTSDKNIHIHTRQLSPLLPTVVTVSFIALCLIFATTVSSLKTLPIVLLAIFCLITFFSFLLKTPVLSKFLFGLLLCLLVYATIFLSVNEIADLINPMDGKVIVNGGIKHIMAMNWIYGVLFGIILTPFSVKFYFMRIPRKKISEQIGVAIFFLILISAYLLKG